MLYFFVYSTDLLIKELELQQCFYDGCEDMVFCLLMRRQLIIVDHARMGLISVALDRTVTITCLEFFLHPTDVALLWRGVWVIDDVVHTSNRTVSNMHRSFTPWLDGVITNGLTVDTIGFMGDLRNLRYFQHL